MDVIDICSSREDSLTSEKVKHLLRTENIEYTIIKKDSSTASSSWWNGFGFPAKLDEDNIYQRIFGYVSCFKCYQTFVYSAKSGTTRIKEHYNKCTKITFSSSSSITIDQSSRSSSTHSTLSHHGFKKSSKLNEKDVQNMKKLCA